MNVLHFSKYDLKGGAAIAARNSVIAQRAQGIDARMIVGRKLGNDPFVTMARSGWLGRVNSWGAFALERAPFRLMPGRGSGVRSLGITGVAPQPFVDRFGADIVVLHNIDGLLPLSGLSGIRVPVIWRAHDLWPFSGTRHTDSLAEAGAHDDRLDRWVAARKHEYYGGMNDLTICPPSHWLADRARASELVPGRQIEVVPNGVDIEIFKPVAAPKARAQLGLPQDAPLILFGAFNAYSEPMKGFDLLEAALMREKDRLQAMGARLVMFGGDGHGVGKLSLPVHDFRHIDDRVQLAKLYSACDVCCVPSRIENLSLTVLESLASGTPVVAFDVGGTADVIETGISGWLV
ncbi:MAG: glycosyltransferase, partial [Pacificimonas sp.]